MDIQIDHYWRKVFRFKSSSGNPKYPNLKQLIKSVLSLHHANADVQRSSDTKNTVTKERPSLDDSTIWFASDEGVGP